MQVMRLDPIALYILKRLDGKTTFWQIYLDCADEVGIISPPQLAAIYECLEEEGFLEGTVIHRRRVGRVLDFFEKIFALDLGTSGADRFVTGLHRLLRPLFNPVAVLLMVLTTVAGLVPFLWCREEVLASITRIDQLVVQAPLLALVVYGSLLLAVAIHELGHGLTCKHFGGKVNRFGVMYYLVMFVCYCDVSSAWNFDRKRDRLLVSLAGPLTTAFLASVCAWAYWLTPAASVFARTTLSTLLVILALGVVMNFNPFIRMDGYYMLMDLTECPNLRGKAFNYLLWRLFRAGSAIPGRDPALLPARLKRLFWFYGIGGVLVTLLLVVRPLLAIIRAILFGMEGHMGRMILISILFFLLLARFAVRAAKKANRRRNQSWKLAG